MLRVVGTPGHCVWLLFALVACGRGEPAPVLPACEGDVLFGRPGPNTGLDAERCRPECSCGGESWSPAEPTEAVLGALVGWTLVEPHAPLEDDPYRDPAPAIDEDAVCAVRIDATRPSTYGLETFATAEAAARGGAHVTHTGPCGLCSPLVNLAVYLRENDLTAPVRQCALDHLTGSRAEHMACLMALGFDEPCASIWYYNTLHTRSACAQVCLAALDDPYHTPDGALNECLRCDEDESGVVFKAVAGRTRRNSGLANAMCRPCAEVRPIEHDYAIP
jgi:hypothetical protein